MFKQIVLTLSFISILIALTTSHRAMIINAAEPSETNAVSHWEGNLWRPEATAPVAGETIEFDLAKDDNGVPQLMDFSINATHGTSSAPNELTCYSGGQAAISNETIMTFLPFGQDIYYLQTTVLNPGNFWGGWNFDGYLGQDIFFNPTGPNQAEGTYVLHYNVPNGVGGFNQLSCDYLWRAVCISGCVPTALENFIYLPLVVR
ncbi:MAG: hypothetical protein GY796_13075 [Chloroflexi bacterium]|nr:hypothetical protein [Chloroflexota bacterium]